MPPGPRTVDVAWPPVPSPPVSVTTDPVPLPGLLDWVAGWSLAFPWSGAPSSARGGEAAAAGLEPDFSPPAVPPPLTSTGFPLGGGRHGRRSRGVSVRSGRGGGGSVGGGRRAGGTGAWRREVYGRTGRSDLGIEIAGGLESCLSRSGRPDRAGCPFPMRSTPTSPRAASAPPNDRRTTGQLKRCRSPPGRLNRAASASLMVKSRGLGGLGSSLVLSAMDPRSAKSVAQSSHEAMRSVAVSRSRALTSPP